MISDTGLISRKGAKAQWHYSMPSVARHLSLFIRAMSCHCESVFEPKSWTKWRSDEKPIERPCIFSEQWSLCRRDFTQRRKGAKVQRNDFTQRRKGAKVQS